jgi:hypothetical protein
MAQGSAFRMVPAAMHGKLSYRTLSISFPDACHIDCLSSAALSQDQNQLS